MPLEVRFENLLALFDRVVASAITVGAKSSDPSDQVTARSLDDSLFELRIWLENVKAIAPDAGPSSDSSRLLGKLEGPAAALFQNVLVDLETDLKDLSADITDMNLVFSENFRATCGRVKASIDRLDGLQDALVKELTVMAGNITLNEKSDTANHRLAVVCFDGGGVRSYSSLIIFKALMDEVRSVARAYEENAIAESIRPRDVFTYIFGSSSGGLIAIMLGRLNMSDEQCKETFRTYAESIFQRHRRRYSVFGPLITSKYSEESIIRATKHVVGSFDPNPESQKWKRNMFAAPAERCRCGVTAYAKRLGAVDVLNVPYVFRTYDASSGARNPGKADDCQIWQVALATTAAPPLFPTAKFDGKAYVDGAFGANNPSHEVSLELSNLHPSNPTCLVSIGSGKRQAVAKFHSRGLGRLYSYVKAAVSLATDTEITHQHMCEVAARSESFSYFRFDVPGLEDVLLDEWTVKRRKQFPNSEDMHTVDFIEKQTNRYLAQEETGALIRTCAQMVVDSYSRSRGLMSAVKYEAAQSPSQSVLQIPARNNLFHGRQETLLRIHQNLSTQERGTASRLKICILYGLGGVGKTQIALEYLHRFKDIYHHVFWVSGFTEAQLVKNYSSIAPANVQGAVSVPDVKHDIKKARDWLSSTDDTWLLVFDDVEWVDNFTSYIPASTEGSIIITSRRKDIDVLGSLSILVEPFDTQTGASLLYSIISSQIDLVQIQDDQLRELSDFLGGLPLAIVTAGQYMILSDITPAEYLQTIKDENTTSFLGDYKETLQTVFDSTLASLTSDARDLVDCMAFFDHNSIPEELFLEERESTLLSKTSSPNHLSIFRFRKLQTELQRICLIRRSLDSKSFSLHRLLKLHLLHRLNSDPRRYVDVFVRALHMMRAIVPNSWASSSEADVSYSGSTFGRYIPHVLCLDEAYVHCDQTLMRAEDNIEFIELLSAAGNSVLATSHFDREDPATKLHQKAVDTSISVLGQEHPVTLTSISNLASVLSRQGKYEDAELLHRQALISREAVLGKDHSDTLTSMSNLASILSMQGKCEDAELLHRQALMSREAVLGKDHSDTLTSISNLASILSMQGKYEYAERLYQQVLEVQQRVLDMHRPDTFTSMSNLASVLSMQGKYKDAEKFYRRAWMSREEVLGKDHRDTRISRTNLAQLLRDKGRDDEAEEICPQAVEIKD